MFREIEGYTNVDADEDWIKVWKLAVPERCRSFLWLLKHDKLLTCQNKNRRGIGDACCVLCGAVCESTLHALRDCTKCMHVWKRLVPSVIMEEFFRLELQDWLKLNVNYCDTMNENWNSTWAIARHALWDWRNKEMHIEGFTRPYEPITNILQRKQEYEKAHLLYHTVKGERIRRINTRWMPQGVNMFKLNTDGASKSNGISGCGGIVRVHKGGWRIGFTKHLGNCNALLAEFWGVFKGLKLTKSLGMTRIEISVDSTMVIKAIEEGSTRQLDCVSILRKIKQLMDEHEVVILTHSYREANKCADILANHGCMKKEFSILREEPSFLKSFIDNDALGILPSVDSLL